MKQTIQRLARYLRGWRAYFGFCQTPWLLERLDKWVRRRVRHAFWRQWRTGSNRCAELLRLGLSYASARQAAGSRRGPWRSCHNPALDSALSNAYLASLGLPSLAPGR